MPARLGIAVELAHEALERLEAAANLGVERDRGFLAPARDPLRAIEASARVLALAAIAARAAPGRSIRLEHRCANAVLAREEERRRKPGEARADDGDVDVD